MHHFINKHNALAILIVIVGAFFAGYSVARSTEHLRMPEPVSHDCPPDGPCVYFGQ